MWKAAGIGFCFRRCGCISVQISDGNDDVNGSAEAATAEVTSLVDQGRMMTLPMFSRLDSLQVASPICVGREQQSQINHNLPTINNNQPKKTKSNEENVAAQPFRPIKRCLAVIYFTAHYVYKPERMSKPSRFLA